MYRLGEVGKLCDDMPDMSSLTSNTECKQAQEMLQKSEDYFKTSKFVIAEGNGVHLPPGCISDRVAGNFVYWNPEGKTISFDRNVRPICKIIKGE